MSLASWLDGVNKKHANTIYASQEIDREYQKIRRRRSKSLGSAEPSPQKPNHIHIPQSNFNRRANKTNMWNDGGLKTPTTPRKTPQTQPSTPTSSWASNRVVGATLMSNRAIPSPKERGIPLSPNISRHVEYPGFAESVESVKRLDFRSSDMSKRSRSPVVSHYDSSRSKDVFGVVLHDAGKKGKQDKEDSRGGMKESVKEGKRDGSKEGGKDGNKENVPPRREAESSSLGTSLGISIDNTSTQSLDSFGRDGSSRSNSAERGPVMRPRQPNVLKRWQPENMNSAQGERKVSPSLRQLKTRSMPTFPPSATSSSLKDTPTNSARSSFAALSNDSRTSDGKSEVAATTTQTNDTFTSFNTILHDIDYAHDNTNATNNKSTLNYTNTHNKGQQHHRSASTPSVVVEEDGDSDLGDISQSSLIELEVSDESAPPQFDLASTPRSDIFSGGNSVQIFPHVIAPKPIHVHVGNPLGRIEEEASVVHRPLPAQPTGSSTLSAPRSPNRGRPLPSPQLSPSMKSPLASPNLPTPRHDALPAPPPSVRAFADAVHANHALKPKRTYKPALSKIRNAPTKLNPPSLSFADTPPPNTINE